MRQGAAVRVRPPERALEVAHLDREKRRGAVHGRGRHELAGGVRVEPVEHPPLAAAGDGAGRVAVELGQGACRHRREGVDLGPERPQRGEQLAAAALVAEVRGLDHDQLAAAQRLGHLRDGRDLQQAPDRGDLLGSVARPLGPGAEHLLGTRGRPDEPAGVELRHRVEGDLDLGDDAEAAPAAAQGPEEVGVRLVVGADDVPARGHDLGGEHARRRKPVLATEPADTAAQRIADDTDVRRRAVERGQAVLDGRVDDVRPDRPGRDTGDARNGVDLDAGHPRRVDEQRAVERARPPRARCPGPRPSGRRAGRARRRRRRRPPSRARRRPLGAGRRRGSMPAWRRPNPRPRGRGGCPGRMRCGSDCRCR